MATEPAPSHMVGIVPSQLASCEEASITLPGSSIELPIKPAEPKSKSYDPPAKLHKRPGVPGVRFEDSSTYSGLGEACEDQGSVSLAMSLFAQNSQTMRESVRRARKKGGTLSGMRMALLTSMQHTESESNHSLLSLLQELKDEMGQIRKCCMPGDSSQRYVERIVQGLFFRVFCIAMIIANTLYIGIEADWRTQIAFQVYEGGATSNQGVHYDRLEKFFVGWFTVELLLRIGAQRWEFVSGEDKQWNMFDGILVALSLVELAVPRTHANFSFLRIFRVFRLVRVVRVVKTVPWLRSLRTMIFALLNSFVCLLWAYFFTALMLYVFSVIFLKGVEDYMRDLPAELTAEEASDMEALKKYFGSLYETMVSLGAAVTGGNDWMQYGELVRKLSSNDFYFLIFQFYVFFYIVGLLNVVTGIFVDSAVCTRTEDEVVEVFKINQYRTREEVKRIFKEADKDQSGTVTYEELEVLLENPWVRAYFSGLELDPTEARAMFVLMDLDQDGFVDIDEFVDGCLKMKGGAKSIDVLSLMYDNANHMEHMAKLATQIERDMNQMKKAQSALASKLNGQGPMSPKPTTNTVIKFEQEEVCLLKNLSNDALS